MHLKFEIRVQQWFYKKGGQPRPAYIILCTSTHACHLRWGGQRSNSCGTQDVQFDAVVHTGRSTAVHIETFSKKSGLVTHVTPPCRPAVATCGGKSAEREVTISQGRTHETARAADGTGRDDVTHVQQRNGRWMYDTSTARSYLHYSVEDSPYKLCHRV